MAWRIPAVVDLFADAFLSPTESRGAPLANLLPVAESLTLFRDVLTSVATSSLASFPDMSPWCKAVAEGMSFGVEFANKIQSAIESTALDPVAHAKLLGDIQAGREAMDAASSDSAKAKIRAKLPSVPPVTDASTIALLESLVTKVRTRGAPACVAPSRADAACSHVLCPSAGSHARARHRYDSPRRAPFSSSQ